MRRVLTITVILLADCGTKSTPKTTLNAERQMADQPPLMAVDDGNAEIEELRRQLQGDVRQNELDIIALQNSRDELERRIELLEEWAEKVSR